MPIQVVAPSFKVAVIEFDGRGVFDWSYCIQLEALALTENALRSTVNKANGFMVVVFKDLTVLRCVYELLKTANGC